MVRRAVLLLLMSSCLLAAAARAASGPADASLPTPGKADQGRLQLKLDRRFSEVKQLQRGAREQEPESRAADLRLGEQVRQLEQLRRQLQAVQGSSTAGNGG